MFYSMFYVLMFCLWKICSICIYLPETDTFIGLRMFPPLCTTGSSPVYREIPSPFP